MFYKSSFLAAIIAINVCLVLSCLILYVWRDNNAVNRLYFLSVVTIRTRRAVEDKRIRVGELDSEAMWLMRRL